MSVEEKDERQGGTDLCDFIPLIGLVAARATRVRFGPPPRVRGTPRLEARSPMPPPVHPRACGEHFVAIQSCENPTRSIPARAGNTRGGLSAKQHSAGPSPRVRGTRSPRSRGPPPPSVHPRACGEHTGIGGAGNCGTRSIPARAGNTVPIPRRMSAMSGPSPRVRGTRRGGTWMLRGNCGPSPRVRGTRKLSRGKRKRECGPSPRVRGTHLVFIGVCRGAEGVRSRHHF